MITKDMGKDTLFFQKDRKEYPVRISNIVSIERKKRVVSIRLSDNTVWELKYTSLSKILQEAQNDRLQLCGRSTIVNNDYIYAVDPMNHYVILRNELGSLELGCYFKEKIMTGLAKQDNEILLRIDNIRYIIRVEELLYAKSSSRVLHIYLRDGREFCVSQKPIEYILQQVRTDKLIRCARGVLVNSDVIKAIDLKRRKILLDNGEQLEIGNRYVADFVIKKQ